MLRDLLRHPWRAAGYLLIGIAIFYAGDWGTYRLRLSRGTGLGTVTVEQYIAIPLKGNKVEYRYTGTADVDCTRSLFPQYASSGWTAPCWWRERHPKQWLEAGSRMSPLPISARAAARR